VEGEQRAVHPRLGEAFLAGALIAAGASVVALVVLPSASSFLPKLRLAPRVSIH